MIHSNNNGEDGHSALVERRPRTTVDGSLMQSNGIPASPSRSIRSRQPAEQEGLDPSRLINSLRRRWPAAFICGLLLGPPLAAAAWFLLVPSHAAVAYIQIDSIEAPLMFSTADREVAGRGSYDLYKNTQSQLITTPFVLNKALINPNIKDLPIVRSQPDSYQWLSENLQIEFPKRGELMAIKLETDQTSSSIAIVNAVVDAYMNEAVLSERNERLQRVDSLGLVYAETEGKVRDRRAEIRRLADTLGTGDSESLSVAQQLSIERYGQVQSELGRVNFDLMRKKGNCWRTGKSQRSLRSNGLLLRQL